MGRWKMVTGRKRERENAEVGVCVFASPNLGLQRVCVVNHLFILHLCVYLASMCIPCIYVYTLHLCVCVQCFFCAMSVDDQLDEDDLELIKENIGVDIQVVSRL